MDRLKASGNRKRTLGEWQPRPAFCFFVRFAANGMRLAEQQFVRDKAWGRIPCQAVTHSRSFEICAVLLAAVTKASVTSAATQTRGAVKLSLVPRCSTGVCRALRCVGYRLALCATEVTAFRHRSDAHQGAGT